MARGLQGLPTVGYESITVSTTAVNLTRSNYDKVPPAIAAVITVDTAPIRWRADGTAPTATEGVFAIPTSDPIVLYGAELAQFQAIRQGGTDGAIRVTYKGAG